MKLAYDLHIHTALSPCAEDDMTPNNIVNMSILKGLDVIAITDHNSCENVPACLLCAENKPLLVIPGMEVETAEEIHVICLFPDLRGALEMQSMVYSRLPDIRNNEAVFGNQLVINQKDEVLYNKSRLLLTSAALSINEVFDVVRRGLKGLAIPAHIDRQANSLLSSFGVMPADIAVSCVEIGDRAKEFLLAEKHPELKKIRKIYSSDAHCLGAISERMNFVEAENTAEGVINLLGKGR